MIVLSARELVLTREKNGAAFTLLVPQLDIHEGSMVAVMGESGCGKSTLLDMLALILRPDKGNMVLRTRNRCLSLTAASEKALAAVRRRDMGYVLQSGGLLPFLSVRENILLPSRLLGILGSVSLSRLRRLTDALGIGDQLDKKPQYLSGGQRQRVAIARALLHRPALVLADEPTAAVDASTALDICDQFRAAVEECGSTAVIVSHDVALLRRYATVYYTFSLTCEAPGRVRSCLHSQRAADEVTA